MSETADNHSISLCINSSITVWQFFKFYPRFERSGNLFAMLHIESLQTPSKYLGLLLLIVRLLFFWSLWISIPRMKCASTWSEMLNLDDSFSLVIICVALDINGIGELESRSLSCHRYLHRFYIKTWICTAHLECNWFKKFISGYILISTKPVGCFM